MKRERVVPAEFLITAADHEAVRQGHYFDEVAADKVCDFFEGFLKHTLARWAGKSFELQPWQRLWLRRLFGWKRPDGLRRFRRAYLECPKKQGKSTLLSGLILYSLIDEPGQESYCGALTASQAGTIFREACRMVAASPRLRKRFRINKSKNTIVWDANNARLKMLSADVDSFDGANAGFVVLDEIHRFKNRNLYDLSLYAGAAREQPLLIMITTAGHDRYSLCWELHEEARSIIEGSTDDLSLLPLIFAASEDDDLDDPAVWRRCNPSLGVITKEEDFAREWAEAKRIPARLNNFKSLRLGIWTQADSSWLDASMWREAAAPKPLEWWVGREVYVGLDLSQQRDLTAMVLITLDQGIAHWQSFYFIPSMYVEQRVTRDKVPYDAWIDQGLIQASDTRSTDENAIFNKLCELRSLGLDIKLIVTDPWLSNNLYNALDGEGFDIRKLQQTYGNMHLPCTELERRLLNGLIAHDNNEVTNWCVGNTVVETDSMGSIKPSKRKSTERIDGVVAGVMALGAATCIQPPTPGIYVL